MELKTESVRGDGLKWQMNTWAASTLYQASASYFIVSDDDAAMYEPTAEHGYAARTKYCKVIKNRTDHLDIL